MAMAIEVRYYTDPACSWSWASEPKLRRLMWEFGDQLSFVWVMGGLAREYGPDYRDEEGGIGSGPDCFADLMAHWIDIEARSGMPFDARLWTENPIRSTYPACQAVEAASEQGPTAAYRYLRRLREGLMTERRKLDHPEALIGEAGVAGLDTARFAIDLSSNAITESFAADLDEVRRPPKEAREAGKVKVTERFERLSFPSAVFVGPGAANPGVWGWQPYELYREAALAAGATVVEERRPEPIDVVRRFGRCATRELEELTGKPRPVLEAELWSLARDWALKAVPVLGGTIWELA
jgi:predicted DsbA family dithiol-disulfide isomerase